MTLLMAEIDWLRGGTCRGKRTRRLATLPGTARPEPSLHLEALRPRVGWPPRRHLPTASRFPTRMSCFSSRLPLTFWGRLPKNSSVETDRTDPLVAPDEVAKPVERSQRSRCALRQMTEGFFVSGFRAMRQPFSHFILEAIIKDLFGPGRFLQLHPIRVSSSKP